MDVEEIASLRALCAAATPGPWNDRRHADGGDVFGCCAHVDTPSTQGGRSLLEGLTRADAAFIAAARTALPAALDEIERLRAAWRTVNAPDEHQDPCRFGEPLGMVTPKHEAPYMQRRQCTCGLHARKAEARALLDGDVR